VKIKSKFWIGIAVCILFLAYALYSMDFRLVWESMLGANWIYLPLFVILVIVQIYLRGLRWYYMLEPLKEIQTKSLVSATAIGFMSNQILPARIGEFVRAYVIGHKENISKMSSFATIVVERVFDGLTLAALLVYLLIFLEVPAHLQNLWDKAQVIGLSSAFFFGFLFVLFFLLDREVSWVKGLFQKIFSIFPQSFGAKLEELFNLFVAGLGVVERGHHLFAVAIYSIAIWGLSILGILLFFSIFDLSLPVIAAGFILLVQAFSVTIPSPPGFIGTFHAGTVIGFTFFGMSSEEALGVAIVMHACMFLSQVGFGMYFLLLEKMSLGEIRHVADSPLTESG